MGLPEETAVVTALAEPVADAQIDTQALARLIVQVLPTLQRAMVAEVHRTPDTSGMSLTQFRVLARLVHREYRATELASALEIGKSTLTITTDSLVRRGYVTRERDTTDDRRSVVLRITPSGQVLYRALESHAASGVACVVEHLSVAERDALEIGVRGLERVLSQTSGETLCEAATDEETR
jgi:DNA-binding MarR family transcriptional regulator